jgi:protoporphyrinogen oxidase
MSVVGGNWQIFNEMIIASGAKLHLNTPVIGIEEVNRHGKTAWRISSTAATKDFDGVVLAAPYVSFSS